MDKMLIPTFETSVIENEKMCITLLYVVYFIFQVPKVSGKCYELQANDSFRGSDRHTEAFRTSVECVKTPPGNIKFIQWRSDISSCLISDSLLPIIPGTDKHALTLFRTDDAYCTGKMSDGKRWRIVQDSELLAGTFQKRECRDLCLLVKDCKLTSYNEARKSCEILREDGTPMISSDEDFTTFIRLYKGFIMPIVKPLFAGHWFARNKLSENRNVLKGKASSSLLGVPSTLQCAVNCYQDGGCRGFSFILSNGTRGCFLTGTNTSMFTRFEYPFTPG